MPQDAGAKPANARTPARPMNRLRESIRGLGLPGLHHKDHRRGASQAQRKLGRLRRLLEDVAMTASTL